MGKAVFVLFFVSIAFAHEVQREFRMQNSTAARGLQEIATTMRTVAEIYQLSVDTDTATITMRGTADQMATADWLMPKLDASGGARVAAEEYRVDGNGEDVLLLLACGQRRQCRVFKRS